VCVRIHENDTPSKPLKRSSPLLRPILARFLWRSVAKGKVTGLVRCIHCWTGITLNVIPQSGAGGFTIMQVAGGHADIAITPLPAAMSQLQAGNVRLLAIIGPERAPEYPTIPTLRDIGYDISWESAGNVIGPQKYQRI